MPIGSDGSVAVGGGVSVIGGAGGAGGNQVTVGGASGGGGGGYQLLQTPGGGLQVVPLQAPSIQAAPAFAAGTLPMLSGYHQAQHNMAAPAAAPISMINMNITNNVQSPMQAFQSNVNNIHGSATGFPVLSGIVQQPLAAAAAQNVMTSQQLIQSVNQNGELVTVTPLFQVPATAGVDHGSLTAAGQTGLLSATSLMPPPTQSINALNQGLINLPMSSNPIVQQPTAAAAGGWPTFSYTPLNAIGLQQQQQHSDSPINMVCKENPINVSEFANKNDDDDEKIDVIHT